MRAWLGVGLLAVVLVGCSGKGDAPAQPATGTATTPAPVVGAPRCDANKITRVVSALNRMKGSARDEVALMGLFGACSQPAVVRRALQGITTATAANRRAMVERAARGNAKNWAKACPGGAGTLTSWRAASAASRAGVVWSGCQLRRHGFARAEELKGDPPYLLPAVFYADIMTDAKVDATHRRVLLRALVGLR